MYLNIRIFFFGVILHIYYSFIINKNILNLKSKNVILKSQLKEPEIDEKIIKYFKKIRKEFPFFKNKNSPIYFDNAATTQKPESVINRMINFYKYENANIHRGIYKLSINATNNYENVRQIIKEYINCDSKEEIIFTTGTTHGFNLVSNMFVDKIIENKEDEIYITYLEHHSNIVPWQEHIKQYKKGKIKFIPLKKNGFINIKKFSKFINKNTKMVSIHHVSNVIGNIQNINKLIKTIKNINSKIIVIIDAAQSFPHIKYDIKKLKKKNIYIDVLIASSHKFCGLLGSGFIYIRKELTDYYSFKPIFYGGNIIKDVEKFKSTFILSPHLFETGTQNIASIICMGESIKFLKKINWKYVKLYEMYLYDLFIYYLKYFLNNDFIQLPIKNINLNDYLFYIHDVKNIGLKKIPIIPLWSNKFSSFDLVTFLDFKNICIRSGNHCSSLTHKYFLKTSNTARISIFFYNTPKEIYLLAKHISSISKMLINLKNIN